SLYCIKQALMICHCIIDPDNLFLLPLLNAHISIFEIDPEAVIPCLPTHPNVTVTLLKNSRNFPMNVVNPKKNLMRFDPRRGFIISYPRSLFNGHFKCRGTLKDREDTTGRIILGWRADDSEMPLPEISTKDARNVLTGENFTLTCSIVYFCIPIRYVNWTVPNPMREHLQPSNIRNTVNNTHEHFESTIVITDTVPEDEGSYNCSIFTYTLRELETSVIINITSKTKPVISATNLQGKTITHNKGNDVNLTCRAFGIPTPNVMWYKGIKRINYTTPGMAFMDNSTRLFITRVTEENDGVYSCKIENSQGSDFANATLKVLPAIGKNQRIHTAGMIGAGIVAAFVLLLLSIILAKFICKERKQRRDLAILRKMLFEQGDTANINPDIPLSDQVELLPYDRRWEFSREKLKLGKPLGQGAFGRVIKAQAYGLLGNDDKPVIVAVKLLKERADLSQQKALLQELKIMIHLGRHVNILNLLGACTKRIDKGELMVIVEYCSRGNLRHFLLNHRDVYTNQVDPRTGVIYNGASFLPYPDNESIASRSRTNSLYDKQLFPAPPTIGENTLDTQMTDISHTESHIQNSGDFSDGSITGGSRTSSRHKKKIITTSDLLCMAFQIARGMEYLADKKLVHRDLAARNILLNEDYIIKICDFGLAKDLYKYTVYKKKGNGPLPVKWMAIESIRDRIFSTQSDVWSFGIVLWELFTLGGNPYPGIEVDEDFFQKLVNGYRLSKPDFASADIYVVMRDCWKEHHKDRPTFPQLVDRIGSQLDDNIKNYYVNLSAVRRILPIDELTEEYLPMDAATMEEEQNDKKVNDYQQPRARDRYVNLPQMTRNVPHEYLIMDTADTIPEPVSPKTENNCSYVNSPEIFAQYDKAGLNLQMNLKNRFPLEAESIPMLNFNSNGDPHYRIPPSGKCVEMDSFKTDSDSSSGIVSDITPHHCSNGTFV
uniref:receptor protein-tyrosine kinase n=1 Tax=Strigamia maritima TaxID=126957 RepID=T1J416_STRMM